MHKTGPYEVGEFIEIDGFGRGIRAIRAGGEYLAGFALPSRLYSPGDSAHLFAASFDLLTAAQEVLENWEKGDLACAVRKLAAAVAKAEGA